MPRTVSGSIMPAGRGRTNNLDEDAEIDDDLWDVVDAMAMRCKDKIVTVRVEAARCLRRLHEPDDPESTATAELLALMHTTSQGVRVALMSPARQVHFAAHIAVHAMSNRSYDVLHYV